MANRMNEWIKSARERLIIQRGGKCVECGRTDHLEFAHLQETGLKGRGRGRKERYYDVVKNPDAYVLLDKGCHRRLDAQAKLENSAFKVGNVSQ